MARETILPWHFSHDAVRLMSHPTMPTVNVWVFRPCDAACSCAWSHEPGHEHDIYIYVVPSATDGERPQLVAHCANPTCPGVDRETASAITRRAYVEMYLIWKMSSDIFLAQAFRTNPEHVIASTLHAQWDVVRHTVASEICP